MVNEECQINPSFIFCIINYINILYNVSILLSYLEKDRVSVEWKMQKVKIILNIIYKTWMSGFTIPLKYFR